MRIGCSSIEEWKNKKKTKTKVAGPYVLPPRDASTAHRIQTKCGRAGYLPNVITRAKCEINWFKFVTLAKG